MTDPKHDAWSLSQEAKEARLMFMATYYTKAQAKEASAIRARRIWLASFGMEGEQRVAFWNESSASTNPLEK